MDIVLIINSLAKNDEIFGIKYDFIFLDFNHSCQYREPKKMKMD